MQSNQSLDKVVYDLDDLTTYDFLKSCKVFDVTYGYRLVRFLI